jgi:hypothetical protein
MTNYIRKAHSVVFSVLVTCLYYFLFVSDVDGSTSSSTKPPKSVYRSASSDSLLSYYLDGHWPRLMNNSAAACAVRYEQDSQSCKACAVPNTSSLFGIPKLLINFQEDEIKMQV